MNSTVKTAKKNEAHRPKIAPKVKESKVIDKSLMTEDKRSGNSRTSVNKKNSSKIKKEEVEFERAKEDWIKESKAIRDYELVVETVSKNDA